MGQAEHGLTRRAAMAGGAALAALASAPARAAGPASRRLAFDIWRNRRRIGQHVVTFDGGEKDFTVHISAAITVSLGPVPVFRYHHQATETWRGGAFAELRSQTLTNGKTERIVASRTAGGVLVKASAGAHGLPAMALPLTHWNQGAMRGPLFNPETGALLRVTVSRQDDQPLTQAPARPVRATRYALSGDADIVDWYDPNGDWAALQGKVKDGSLIEYRRVV